MFESALHRRVVLAFALAALALSGASAGVVAGTTAETADAPGSQPPAEIDHPVESSDLTTASNVSATVVYEGDRLVLRAAPNQTVRLRTNAAPGTTFQIELRSNGNFHTLVEATASEDGTAVATLDLSDFEAGTDIRLVVRHDQAEVGDAPGVVTDPASTTESVTTSPGTTARPTTMARSTTTATTTTPTTYDESGFPFTTTATTTPATSAGSSTEGQADGFGVPGFGAPAALAGLLGALALARRRRA